MCGVRIAEYIRMLISLMRDGKQWAKPGKWRRMDSPRGAAEAAAGKGKEVGKFFDLESPVMRVLSRVADMMILNLLTLLLCIPVITAGSALSAMYYVELKWARKEEGYIVRPFFQQFKENFKQATGEWLIMLALIVVLALDLLMFHQAPDTFPKAIRYLVIAVTIILYLLLQWVFPLQSHFVNHVRTTFKNSALMAIANFPRTLGIGGIWAAFAALTVLSILLVPQIFPLVFLFGFTAPGYVTCLLISKPFARFEPRKEELTEEEDEAEKEEAYRVLNENR